MFLMQQTFQDPAQLYMEKLLCCCLCEFWTHTQKICVGLMPENQSYLSESPSMYSSDSGTATHAHAKSNIIKMFLLFLIKPLQFQT